MSIEDAVGRTSALPVAVSDPPETAEQARPLAVSEPPTPEGEPLATSDADTSRTFRRTSIKQVEANRRNARNSTGPTTLEGKRASRLNALTHGLRAKEVIIPGESPAEFEAILKELREDWQPVGHTERHLVEEIGLAEWRLCRGHRAELGEIRTQLAGHKPREKSSTTGIAYERQVVAYVLNEIEFNGEVSEESFEQLEDIFGDEEDSLAATLKLFFIDKRPEANEKGQNSNGQLLRRPPCAKQRAACEYLETTLKDLVRQERKQDKQQRIDLEIVRQRLSIPRARELETIQRYETVANRDLYRAIDQLENLQRRRRGEPSPPTVNVNVSNDRSD